MEGGGFYLYWGGLRGVLPILGGNSGGIGGFHTLSGGFSPFRGGGFSTSGEGFTTFGWLQGWSTVVPPFIVA